MTTQNNSRRRFLKRGCLTTAAIGITVTGGGALALNYQPKIDFPEMIIGENSMDKRILVAYASKAGSTAEIAARVGETLSQRNRSVDVLPVAKVKDISSYDAVIVGSAIRMGSVLPEVKSFVEKNQTELNQKSFNMFVACMTLNDDTEANRETVSAYLDPIRAIVSPASEGLFAGVIDSSKLSLLDRLIVKAIKPPIGDFRKWNQIQNWAANIAL